jgi:tetratricopeptide (TPR) repeat protein
MYFAILAVEQGLTKKAKLLFDMISKNSQTDSTLNYNLGKWYVDQNDAIKAKMYFDKISDKSFISEELNIFNAIESYKAGNCLGLTEPFDKIKTNILTEKQLLPIYAECLSLKGETDQALRLLKSELKTSNKHEGEIWLQIARLQEGFKFEKQEAITAYKQAAEKSSDKDLISLIQKKLSVLSGGPVAGGI